MVDASPLSTTKTPTTSNGFHHDDVSVPCNPDCDGPDAATYDPNRRDSVSSSSFTVHPIVVTLHSSSIASSLIMVALAITTTAKPQRSDDEDDEDHNSSSNNDDNVTAVVIEAMMTLHVDGEATIDRSDRGCDGGGNDDDDDCEVTMKTTITTARGNDRDGSDDRNATTKTTRDDNGNDDGAGMVQSGPDRVQINLGQWRTPNRTRMLGLEPHPGPNRTGGAVRCGSGPNPISDQTLASLVEAMAKLLCSQEQEVLPG
ncbi:hypothetical protein EDB89DRAFT_1912572 [Lactarius sanguifluus]|nr:hypothetical protein EDB89DRAFT_1912572 [Lactarius sanguifluus]